jgi:tetratricopeptide (TPR) repeat protein
LAGLTCLQFNAFVVTTAFFFFLTCIMVMSQPVAAPIPERARLLTRAISMPLAAGFFVFAVLLVGADLRLAGIRRTLEAGKVVEAASAFESLRRCDPRPGASDLYYSRNMGALVKRQETLLPSVKALQEAIQAGLRATERAEDRQNAWYHLATLYAQINNSNDTEKSLRGAIRVAPRWFKPHWTLAQLLHVAGGPGRRNEALAEARTAVQLDGGKHPEVAETLRMLEAGQ